MVSHEKYDGSNTKWSTMEIDINDFCFFIQSFGHDLPLFKGLEVYQVSVESIIPTNTVELGKRDIFSFSPIKCSEYLCIFGNMYYY